MTLPTPDLEPDQGPWEVTTFAEVPAADRDAEVDSHWLELRSGGLLPDAYMPPTMRGDHRPALRVLAVGLIGMFLFATVMGICLTYGPP